MKVALALAALLGVLAATVRAEDGDDTLRFFLSKADVVVLGEFTVVSGPKSLEAGINCYDANFKIDRLIKGQQRGARKPGGTIEVGIVRHEFFKEDRLPLLGKGSKAILFLKHSTRQQDGAVHEVYRTADVWFGIQPASSTLAGALERLAKE